MKIPETKPEKDIILLGGGHAHSLLLKEFMHRPLHNARLFVVEPKVTVAYSGMLPGFIAGIYQKQDLEIDILRLSERAGATLILDAAHKIDPKAKKLYFEKRAPITYDILSINIGINTILNGLAGFTQFGQAVKPLGAFAERWHHIVKSGHIPPNICIIGGGIAGVELALACAYAHRNSSTYRVRIIEKTTLLSSAPHRLKQKLFKILAAQKNIEIFENTHPIALSQNSVTLEDGRVIPADFTFSTTGANPYKFLQESGLTNEQGFLVTHKNLALKNHSNIFGVGDCAVIETAPRPRAGVYAVRAAPILANNLRAHLAQKPLRNFHPQKDFLKLVYLGGKNCIANRGKWVFSGPSMWRLKDWIDRRFMHLFAPPPSSPLLNQPMLCKGCGAKIGAQPLQHGLSMLGDTIIGDDAAIIHHDDSRITVHTTDHLRAFSRDLFTMARITALHAMSDIWAMGATAETALLNITLEENPFPLSARDLEMTIAGFKYECKKARVRIIGGHTSFGAETTLGMTLTGIYKASPIIQNTPKDGDLLILTKPLGIGTILAGAMQGKATGHALNKAYKIMLQSNQNASKILQKAHAMTDVTGFGLAGHLANMLRASHCVGKINRDALPILDEAQNLAAIGVRSSIYNANKTIKIKSNKGDIEKDPRDIMLYDPQTSGGLLAAIAPKKAEKIQMHLIENGYESAIIGHCLGVSRPMGHEEFIRIS